MLEEYNHKEKENEKMKRFEIVCGDPKLVTLVQINGTTALAKDAKPKGHLLGIVKGTDVDGKVTYYLCMETEAGVGVTSMKELPLDMCKWHV